MSKLVSKEAFQLVHWEGALGGGGKRENRGEEQRAERECGAGLVPMLKRWMMQVQAWFVIGRQRGRATKLQTASPRLTSASPAFFSLILATSLSGDFLCCSCRRPKENTCCIEGGAGLWGACVLGGGDQKGGGGFEGGRESSYRDDDQG